MEKPIYEVADIIMQALAANDIEVDTVTGSDSVEFNVTHKGERIHFFMTYEGED